MEVFGRLCPQPWSLCPCGQPTVSAGVALLSNLLAVGGSSGLSPEALVLLPALPADNHAQLSRASLRIRILDVNDNPPELATPYEAAVCEDAKPGQVPMGTGDQRCCHERAPHSTSLCTLLLLTLQLIQTISVVDRDEPQGGHRFYFRLVPEEPSNPHFSLLDIEGEPPGNHHSQGV